WLVLSAFLMFWFSRTALGRMANAVRDNPERVEFLGYSARWVRFYSFVASGFFAGVAGGLSAINYEIMTEENLNLMQSGTVLLVTFLGGAGFFVGPIVGAVVFTLLSTVLSLQTELWQLYVGALFVATVMFFPGGMVGLLMMHAPLVRAGKLGHMFVPYLKTLLPGAIALLGLACITEMVFHLREATPGDHEMTLFWITFDSHSIVPWAVVLGITGLAFWQTRRTTPELRDAWASANEGADE
ncbi:MAG: branched-chain amino acid ABC transporter permease, partial [Pseudomonadota bacterium]